MKMQTTAGQLTAGLRQFRGIIQKRNTIPVLGMVRFRGGAPDGDGSRQGAFCCPADDWLHGG